MATIFRSPIIVRRVTLPPAQYWSTPNLLTSTLFDATGATPFENYILDPQRALPRAIHFEPPNLLASTLAPAAPAQDPFRTLLGETSRLVYIASAFDAPNLLGTTLAPQAPAEAPFHNEQWDISRVNRAAKASDAPNLLASTLGQAIVPEQWDGAVRIVYAAKAADAPNLLTGTLRAATAQTPFQVEPTDTAKRKAQAASTEPPNLFDSLLAPAPPVGTPFAEFAWPSLKPAKKAAHSDPKNLIVYGVPPGAAPVPFNNESDALASRARAAKAHEPANLLDSLLSAKPFANTVWDAPRAPRRAQPFESQNYLNTVLAVAAVTNPFANSDWPTLQRIIVKAPTFDPPNLLLTTLFVAPPVGDPFFVSDWPNPAIAAAALARGIDPTNILPLSAFVETPPSPAPPRSPTTGLRATPVMTRSNVQTRAPRENTPSGIRRNTPPQTKR